MPTPPRVTRSCAAAGDDLAPDVHAEIDALATHEARNSAIAREIALVDLHKEATKRGLDAPSAAALEMIMMAAADP